MCIPSTYSFKNFQHWATWNIVKIKEKSKKVLLFYKVFMYRILETYVVANLQYVLRVSIHTEDRLIDFLNKEFREVFGWPMFLELYKKRSRFKTFEKKWVFIWLQNGQNMNRYQWFKWMLLFQIVLKICNRVFDI